MRGSLNTKSKYGAHPGIIPAHAGLTRPVIHAYNGLRDHPRACGAHLIICITNMNRLGSSPRMRGSLYELVNSATKEGIIPAHAGLTETFIDNDTLNKGSSPRMRGSLKLKQLESMHMGIIPAHAGLTMWKNIQFPCTWDHPRACGAHLSGRIKGFLDLGSSPRMRGSH